MKITIHSSIRKKLSSKKPPVTEKEIVQCLENIDGEWLTDTRENNQTTPPTFWMISETNTRRLLKVCVIFRDGEIIIKTAYDPDDNELAVYRKHGYP